MLYLTCGWTHPLCALRGGPILLQSALKNPLASLFSGVAQENHAAANRSAGMIEAEHPKSHAPEALLDTVGIR
jgi:hypothetical protein